MKPLACVCGAIAALAMAVTGPLIGTTDAAQGKEKKTVPLKVVVLIDAKTKGISEGANIKQIETLREAAVAKKPLDDVRHKDGKTEKWLNGTYDVQDARITLADDAVVACQVLVAIEPGKTTLRNVKYVSVLLGVSDKEGGVWYGYTAEFDTPAPRP